MKAVAWRILWANTEKGFAARMQTQLPSFTGIDALTQGVSGVLYVLVGVAAWLSVRGDSRTRVFLGLALANAAAFALPTVAWLSGTADLTSLGRASVGALICAFLIGSVVLFHFCQVFPRRRPWIRRFSILVTLLYVGIPVIVAGLVLLAPSDIIDVSAVFAIPAILLGLPLFLLVGLVLPVGGVLSLVKSYREADGKTRAMRTPLLLLLISQVGGGTIALIFAPVLATIAPNPTAKMAVTMTAWLLGMLTPVAFALAVWKYGLPPDER
jgi:hypothetical protein